MLTVRWAYGIKGHQQGDTDMFKIEIRSNGSMVDYSDQRFSCRKDAQKVICNDKVTKKIWADMRVVPV